MRTFFLSYEDPAFIFLLRILLWLIFIGTTVAPFFSRNVAGANERTFLSIFPWSGKFSFIKTYSLSGSSWTFEIFYRRNFGGVFFCCTYSSKHSTIRSELFYLMAASRTVLSIIKLALKVSFERSLSHKTIIVSKSRNFKYILERF